MTRPGSPAARRPGRRPTRLAALAAALAGMLLAAPAAGQDLVDEPAPADPAELPPADAGAPAAEGAVDERVILNGLATMPATAVEAFTARPLFSPSRRPPPDAEPEPPPVIAEEPPPEEPVPEEPPTAPTMQLTGTFEGPDGIAALMRDPATGESMTARLGDDVEGWAVTAITATTITLELDGAVLDLALFEPTPADELPAGDGSDGGDWGDPTMGPVPNDWLSQENGGADGGGGEGMGVDGPGADGMGVDGPGADGMGVDGPGADGMGVDGPDAGGPDGAGEPAEARSARPPGARPQRRGFDPAALGLDPTMSGG